MIREGQKIGSPLRRKTCPICKQKFWCYPLLHQWTLSIAKGDGENMWGMRAPADLTNNNRYVKYFCSYHCMRVEDKKRLAKSKRKYARLMWEAANLYDENGNPIGKRKPGRPKKGEEVAA